MLLRICGEKENWGAFLDKMKERAGIERQDIADTASRILLDIKTRGYKAVSEYSMRFDGALPYEITREQIEDAYEKCDPQVRSALIEAEKNICAYHECMRAQPWQTERAHGAVLGQIVLGLDRVGIYVPGGTAAYPSSVLMIAVPAKVAGVREIIVVTPPSEHLKTSVLAACKIAGVDRVIALGGVQAVGALAYGAGFIPRVDKIAGPGNAYVAAAKREVYGEVDIDMIAGPSEILVIADEHASPSYIAADLLSQSEHDALSSAILVTTSEAVARRVAECVEKQCAALPRSEIARASLENFGAAIVCASIQEAADIANRIAPEHLEILTEKPRSVLPMIKNAGAVFLGPYSPEPLGDYMAGPSHVLPTNGTARFFSVLSTETFTKRMSVIEYTKDALLREAPAILALAREEGLDAHGNAVLLRTGSACGEDAL